MEVEERRKIGLKYLKTIDGEAGAVQSLLWKETINQILASGKKELQFLTDPHLKLVQPEDVARAVLYLADEKNNIITGTSINVDNGVYSGL
ncbi:MAG: SDR family oxidoreductase [Streptococcus salivarius]